MPAVLHSRYIDEVILAIPSRELEAVRELLTLCEEEGLQTRIISNFFSGMVAKAEVVHGIPIITYRMAPHKEWQLFVKRAFDIVFSSVIIILLSPLLLAIALAVKLTSPGPVK